MQQVEDENVVSENLRQTTLISFHFGKHASQKSAETRESFGGRSYGKIWEKSRKSMVCMRAGEDINR